MTVRYLDLRELADMAGISHAGIRALRRAGGVPTPDAQVGNHAPGWAPATAEQWLAERRERARTDARVRIPSTPSITGRTHGSQG